MAFIFGGDTGETQSSIETKRRLAAALMQQGGQTTPIQSPWQGVARLSESLMGGLALRRQAAQEQEANAQVMAAITGQPYTPPAASPGLFGSLFGGGKGVPAASDAQGQVAATSPAADQSQASPAGGMQGYQNAISSIESSGNYGAVGPSSPTMGRALGKYQVIEANIGPWSQEALGRTVTPEEFLANPQLQDAIFNKKFGDYVQKFGPSGAAQAWFAGPGGVGKLDRQDSLGTSVAAYTDKFNRALGPQAPAEQAIQAQAPAQVASLDPSAGMPAPGAASQMQANNPAPVQTADPGAQTPAQQPPQATSAQAPAPAPQRLAQALQTQPPVAVNPIMTNPRAKALAAAMMNPNASPQVRQLAGSMFQQEMSRGQALYQAQVEQYIKQQDPEYQANLAKAQYEVQHLGEVSPDTKATLAAQEQKMKFDAQQQMNLADHTQQLKQNDPLQQATVAKTTAETANILNPRMTPAEQAASDLAKQKEAFEESKGVTVPAGQSLVAPGGPNAGKVIYQGTGYSPSDVHDVRKEFESLPNYKAYQQAAPVYQSMIDTAKTDSKASDLNLVYGLGKIMDPNSVVREGEMVMVNNTSSLPDWVQGAINAVNGGSRLEPATRTAILNEARSRMGAYRSVLDNDVNQYTGIAQRRGMNPADIIPVLNPIADVPKLDEPKAAPVTGITNDWQEISPGVRIRKVN